MLRAGPVAVAHRLTKSGDKKNRPPREVARPSMDKRTGCASIAGDERLADEYRRAGHRLAARDHRVSPPRAPANRSVATCGAESSNRML